MFTDIELFKEEREKFYASLRELNESDVPDKDVRTRELNIKFRDDIRKYLPTCLNIINTNYNCHFSIYKVGKDYDSSFNVIETNVKKTRNEIECELTNYRSLLNTNALTEKEKEQLDLATEIIITYVDDPTEPKREDDEFLKNARPVNSSIITTSPVMQMKKEEPKATNEIQYNPYANQPIQLEEQPQQEESNLGIFASMMETNDSNSAPSQKMTMDNLLTKDEKISEQPKLETSQNSNMGIFFDQNMFDNNDPKPSVQMVDTPNKFVTPKEEQPPKEEQIPSTDLELKKDLTENKEVSNGQGMDLGMLNGNINIEGEKNLNDLLAPMQDN